LLLSLCRRAVLANIQLQSLGIPTSVGDKAKEATKKASKAKSAVSQARHFMKLSDVSDEKSALAEELITEIQACLDRGDFTRAASRGEKLGKLF
ncbi:MAG: hypothetical protein CXX81_12750, partial [Methanobacteriota archaeon]